MKKAPSVRAVHDALREIKGEDGLEFPLVNRYALILEPTEKFLDWVNSTSNEVNQTLTLDQLKKEPHVYLIPESSDPNRWLRENCQGLFDHELNSWYTDTSTWPQDRSFKVFKLFFSSFILSMVVDASEAPLERNDE